MNKGFDVGDTLVVKCVGCHRWFDWVVSPGWAASVPSYHSKRCKIAHKERIAKSEVWRCPRPDKRLYRNDAEGRVAATALCKEYNELFGEYRCECGGIHVGKKKYWVKERVHE